MLWKIGCRRGIPRPILIRWRISMMAYLARWLVRKSLFPCTRFNGSSMRSRRKKLFLVTTIIKRNKKDLANHPATAALIEPTKVLTDLDHPHRSKNRAAITDSAKQAYLEKTLSSMTHLRKKATSILTKNRSTSNSFKTSLTATRTKWCSI